MWKASPASAPRSLTGHHHEAGGRTTTAPSGGDRQASGAARPRRRGLPTYRARRRSGELDVDAPAGKVRHAGGLRFEAAGGAVQARDLVLEADRGLITAAIGNQRLPLLTLEMGRLRVPQTGDRAVWPGTAELAGEAARVIRDRLGVNGLRGGQAMGAITVSGELG